MAKFVPPKFAVVEFKPCGNADGSVKMHAYADGALLGRVVTNDDGSLSVVIMHQCLKKPEQAADDQPQP